MSGAAFVVVVVLAAVCLDSWWAVEEGSLGHELGTRGFAAAKGSRGA
jgi:fatty-acid desaturase